MSALYPLRFIPIFRRYLWGGRKLGSRLGKPIGPERDYAESWEIVDHGEDQSRVMAGSLAGVTLGELVTGHGEALLGRHHPQPQFPLLFKYLDCEKTLSVQVHPNDAQAARLNPPDFGKTEAWVVLSADPGSVIYAGLKRGFDRAALEREVHRGTCELCLHRIAPHTGDCIFLPAGTIHALGAGLMIAEIQQSSDTTFRLYDWNRLGDDGKPRPLHIEQALEVIDYTRGPVSPQSPHKTDRPHAQRLVECDKFILDRLEFTQSHPIGGDRRFHIVSVLHGAVEISGDPVGQPLKIGETVLIPADVENCQLTAIKPTTLLDIYLP
jgi:mannose-6-phosphate isomerase